MSCFFNYAKKLNEKLMSLGLKHRSTFWGHIQNLPPIKINPVKLENGIPIEGKG